MDRSNKGQRERDDLELASMSSGISSMLSSAEGSINNISSGDISTTSGSSGEIPTSVVVPRDIDLAREELNMMAIVTEREKCVGRNNKGVSWGYTSVIGRRKEMEDAVAVIPSFMSRTCNHVGGCTAPGSRTSSEISPIHFFGVYDGHGGSQVANFCKERMHEVILEEWDRDQTIDGCEWQRRWEATFSSGFGRADNEVLTEGVAPELVGSTAVVVVLSGCQIITSNCGDSRAVLFRRTEAIPLTVDQKPDRSDELMRIEGQGGRVINWNGARVLGVLAMSRAIGFLLSTSLFILNILFIFCRTFIFLLHLLNFIAAYFHVLGDRYLRPWIIPVPEVTFMTRTDEDECLILASDGLWDVMTNEEVGEVARRILRRWRRSSSDGFSPAQTVADNLQEIAYGRNSSDNISIIVVDLKKRRRQVRQSRGD
ncbi:hypothetical protein POTOM_023529 [Populus tomentosa]|uniref:protein-serine/threonine phosphatase n=1 Tax=Populus tomentosa TaxID=118781 RepID=A0A8X7ZIV0_POPTO|nr:hypothetical protein POTOM_023529 [Populus tomentosa]